LFYLKQKDARKGKKVKEKKLYIKPKVDTSNFLQFMTLSAQAEVNMDDLEGYSDELASFWELTQ